MSLKINFESGGTAVLDRIIEAYGFKTKVALAEHLGIASSSLAMRYRRDYFPSDIVVRCMAETGATLEWLTTGTGSQFNGDELDVLRVPKHKIVDGQVYDAGVMLLDRSVFLPGKNVAQDPLAAIDGTTIYVVEREFSEVYDGEWLVEIEGKTGIRNLTRIPVKKVRVSGPGAAFDCDLADINIIGCVVLTIING
ncbi:phage repressor protein CI [Edwardsiella tarda]|uniref:phage repressor protein CI n=1 Tax=Edwardsiella tarda TaxID=636 RepID=UPI00351C5B14